MQFQANQEKGSRIFASLEFEATVTAHYQLGIIAMRKQTFEKTGNVGFKTIVMKEVHRDDREF